MPDAHAVRSRHRKDLPVSRALNIAPDPQFADAKIFKDRGQASQVILVGMREGDNIDLFEPARPQIRRNNILANINPGAHPARMKISEFAAPVDQHRAPAREGKKKAVALAHIEHRQFQALWREARRKRISRDDCGSGEQALPRSHCHQNPPSHANCSGERDCEPDKTAMRASGGPGMR